MSDFPFTDRAFVCGKRPKRSFNEELISAHRQAKWGGKSQSFGRVGNDAQAPSQRVSQAIPDETPPPEPGSLFKASEGPYRPPVMAAPAPSLPEPAEPPCATEHPLPASPSGHTTEVFRPPPAEDETPLDAARRKLQSLKGKTGANRERTKARAIVRRLEAAARPTGARRPRVKKQTLKPKGKTT